MTVGDICTIVGTGAAIIGVIIGATWRLASRISELSTEVRGHNHRLDDLTEELKTHIKNDEARYIRRGE